MIDKIYITFFLLFLLAFQLVSGNSNFSPSHLSVNDVGYVHLELSTQKAIETRRLSDFGRFAGEPRGTLAEEELAREITATAPDYSLGETHDSSIMNFIESNFGVTPKNLFCVDSTRINKREFVFIDKENRIVVKVFPQIKKKSFKIVHELSGHQAFKTLNLEQANLVNFLALGKYSLNGTDYLVLGMSYAEGQEIRKFVDAIYSAKNLTEKKEAIDLAKRTLGKLGEVLGEVHLKSAIKVAPTLEYIKEIINYYYKKISKNINEYKKMGGTESEMLENHFAQVLEQYNQEDFYFSLFHGDAHLANFLFDSTTGQITIIDSVRTHRSVDPNEVPISDQYLYDPVKVEKDIVKIILSYENNDDLIRELIEAFYERYVETIGSIINFSHLQLEKSYLMLKELVHSLNWKSIENSDSAKYEMDRRVHDYYERTFHAQIINRPLA